ncbi:MAG: hypothetical protein IPG50_05630 [Myxococcales bacterium]|nr:hypothetical protein [Myxococcales bacterium]
MRHSSLLWALGAAGIALHWTSAARAVEEPERGAQPRDVNQASSAAATRDDAIAELKDRIKAAELQGRYERVLRDNELARARAKESAEPGATSGDRIEHKALLLPDLFGVTVSSGAPIPGIGLMAGPLTISSSAGTGPGTQTLSFRPAADVVVAKRWTVGGALTATRWAASSRPANAYSLGAAPRAGVLIPLGRGVTLWPEVELGVTRFRSEMFIDADLTQRSLGIVVTPKAGVAAVFPLSRHVFFRVGSQLAYAVVVDDGDYGTTESFALSSDARLGLML